MRADMRNWTTWSCSQKSGNSNVQQCGELQADFKGARCRFPHGALHDGRPQDEHRYAVLLRRAHRGQLRQRLRIRVAVVPAEPADTGGRYSAQLKTTGTCAEARGDEEKQLLQART